MPNYPAFPLLNRGQYGPVAPGSSNSPQPRVLTAGFGGGYAQRTGDGTNMMPRNFTYKSAPLQAADMAVLTQFLEGRKGYLPFTWTIPGEAGPRQWICEKWSQDYTYPLHSTLSAQFVENFDP